MTRRRFLGLGAVGTASLCLCCTAGTLAIRPWEAIERGSALTGKVLSSERALPEPFKVPLPVPSVLRPARTDATTDYYEITQKVSRQEILPGVQTEIWGYNGVFPGPTIKSRSGRRVVVRHRNELPIPTVVHLHGGKTPPEHDGYPTDLVLPVNGWDAGHEGHVAMGQISHGVREYVYPLDQPAATLWYHDHRMDFTGPQVYRGLAGFHLVHDDAEDALPLPGGDRDIPLMIGDRAFAEDGSLRYPSIDPTLKGEPGVEDGYMRGVLGDAILVNAAPWPYLEVSNTRYRFRILNASNARRYKLALDPPPSEGPSFLQVGSDVGLLGQPVHHEHIETAPAERFDVVIDFSAYPVGTAVTLVNQFGRGTVGQVMRFIVARAARDESDVPSRLVALEPLRREDATVTRKMRFNQGDREMWTINGEPFDPERIDAQPSLGATEIWQISTNAHHPVHLHLAHFQVLSRRTNRSGGEAGPYDAGWKDTIDLASGDNAEIIARFDGYRGRYVFHCHNLEHEDMAMMANLEVV